ncbi:hypothetical protein [Massilia antarctica]|uniref:hypothetical protein n=1 Tax=Massilia antarctica TaxID=2765360 RepID=UPI0011AFC746|nr:hypothetical protein [Massilia sp. H27-R4]MCY0915655.1 hypothetical protein [Massilia sp. H27-R4]
MQDIQDDQGWSNNRIEKIENLTGGHMSKWIELAPKSMFFGSKLAYVTSIVDFPAMDFISDNRTMKVVLDNKCIVAVDNWRSLRIGSTLLNAKSKRLMVVGLECDGLGLDFRWSVDGPVDFIHSEIACTRKVNDIFCGSKKNLSFSDHD